MSAHRASAHMQFGDAQSLRQSSDPGRLGARTIVGILGMTGFTETDVVGYYYSIMRGEKTRHPREIILIATEAMQKNKRFTFAAFQINIMNTRPED